jgi:hypothetical protein
VMKSVAIVAVGVAEASIFFLDLFKLLP